MPNYLTSNVEFCGLSPFNEDQAAELEASRPGHLMALSAAISSGVDARLRKRYKVPFGNPAPTNCPLKIKMWVADLLTPRAYLSLGVRPSDEQQEAIIAAAKLADSEIKEAADAKEGLFELPLLEGLTASAIDESIPLAYSEQSVFTSKHAQFEDSFSEIINGR